MQKAVQIKLLQQQQQNLVAELKQKQQQQQVVFQQEKQLQQHVAPPLPVFRPRTLTSKSTPVSAALNGANKPRAIDISSDDDQV